MKAVRRIFPGKIKVSVVIKNQTIRSINILSNSDDEAFFNRAKEGVTASILAKQSTDVDTVSGATYSSRGIINAVKDALSSSDGEEQTVMAKGDFALNDGYYEGTGNGFAGPVKLFIEIKDKSIIGIYIVKTSDDAGFFNRAKEGVTASILEKQSLSVDTVSVQHTVPKESLRQYQMRWRLQKSEKGGDGYRNRR